MFSKCNIVNPNALLLDFDLWEITGRWVSQGGAPVVNIYRNISHKQGGFRLEFIYNNPQVIYDCAVKCVFGQYYIDLYGRIGIAYDREREVLILSAYGEYIRAEE